MRIAIIETNYQTARLLQLMLLCEQHDAEIFVYLADLLDAPVQNFDCIIVNPGFPRVAPDLIKNLMAQYSHIPRIYTTLFNDVPEMVHIADPGSFVLSMPFHRRELIGVHVMRGSYTALPTVSSARR